jgi:hypothetical protein
MPYTDPGDLQSPQSKTALKGMVRELFDGARKTLGLIADIKTSIAGVIKGTPGTSGNLAAWGAGGVLGDSGIPVPGAWTDWATTPTNLTKGSGGTLVSRCCKIGKTRICHIEFTYGTGSSISGEPSFSLPDDVNAAVTLLTGTGTLYDSSAGSSGRFDAFVFNGTSSTVIIRLRNANGTYVQYTSISATVPFTWAAGDKMVLDFTYEAA